MKEIRAPSGSHSSADMMKKKIEALQSGSRTASANNYLGRINFTKQAELRNISTASNQYRGGIPNAHSSSNTRNALNTQSSSTREYGCKAQLIMHKNPTD